MVNCVFNEKFHFCALKQPSIYPRLAAFLFSRFLSVSFKHLIITVILLGRDWNEVARFGAFMLRRPLKRLFTRINQTYFRSPMGECKKLTYRPARSCLLLKGCVK